VGHAAPLPLASDSEDTDLFPLRRGRRRLKVLSIPRQLTWNVVSRD
jgi:hypothetical protein